MKHFNLTNNDPVNKIIMSITNVNQLNSLRKVGNYGITSKIPINGSKNFSIELLTVSVNGNLIMRQTTGDTDYPQTFIRSLNNDNHWNPWTGPVDSNVFLEATNVIYVDNKRTDVYTEIGTYNLPFKTITAAQNSITGNSSSNRFVIKIATGSAYTETLTISKDFTTFEGYGETILSGNITITAPHFRLKNLKVTGNVTGTYTTAFLAEISDCSVTVGTWTVSCSVGGSYIQITGGTTIWTANINLSGITGVVSCQGGYFEGTHNFTNCYMEIIGFENYGGTINLETGTEIHIGGSLCIDTIVNLKTGATAYVDAITAGGITLNNTGGTLHLTTKIDSISPTVGSDTTGDLYCRTSNGVFGRIAAPTVASTLKHSGIVGSLPYWVAD